MWLKILNNWKINFIKRNESYLSIYKIKILIHKSIFYKSSTFLNKLMNTTNTINVVYK